ncbi:uncharacterized protein LOC108736723 [Agrilus planipennis]|uniref:Uncharacterized protein LOC108736723 n=1 Tax=Agrilus planipennis TaxID=224129 RepID=A0A1W4WLG3_AGRPL|nr:uncharacterized protein LOC108736723 [Agrilus planipennis]
MKIFCYILLTILATSEKCNSDSHCNGHGCSGDSKMADQQEPDSKDGFYDDKRRDIDNVAARLFQPRHSHIMEPFERGVPSSSRHRPPFPPFTKESPFFKPESGSHYRSEVYPPSNGSNHPQPAANQSKCLNVEDPNYPAPNPNGDSKDSSCKCGKCNVISINVNID